jgi:hypothetical protein
MAFTILVKKKVFFSKARAYAAQINRDEVL